MLGLPSGKSLLKTPLRRTLVIASFVGLALVFHFVYAGSGQQGSKKAQNSPASNAVISPKQVQISAVSQMRLKIPKINVDAAVEPVGLTSQGVVGAPLSLADAAWYYNGPRPGDKGNSIMDGHFSTQSNAPAVFDNLYKLQKGDKIYVQNKNGAATTFIVRELRTYGQSQTVPEVFISNDSKAHLNLITCEGIWDKVQKSFSDRLVVFTDRE